MSTNEWLGDLSLLYHYLATDGLCLSHENRQGELWQNIVPELAFTRVRTVAAALNSKSTL